MSRIVTPQGPDIWIPKTILENRDMLDLRTRVGGEVQMKVFKSGIKEPRIDTGWFPNLVLDSGLDLIASTASTTISSQTTQCHVGGSNTAPANDQTGLITPIASTTNSSDLPTYGVAGTFGVDSRTEITLSREFSVGAAAGVLREVGFGPSGSGPLFSRALIVDGGGSPTDITVLADEILQVSYRISIYHITSSVLGSFNMSGAPHDFEASLPNISGSSSNLKFANHFPSTAFHSVFSGATFGGIGVNPLGGATAAAGSNSNGGYSAGNHYRDGAISSALNQANVAGGSFNLLWINSGTNGGPAYKILIDPPIAKDNTKLMTLNFRCSWGRK